jgi:hypothetical protein
VVSAWTSLAQDRALIDKYCVTCHNDKAKTAGLSLETADLARPSNSADIWEKVIRKLRAEMMPPVGAPRPDKTAATAVASYLEMSIDAAAAANPNPGRTVLHRLNRAEYGNAVRDLFAIQALDVTSLLPADTEAYGFDNIGDVLGTSPALMERYLSAAWKMAGIAVASPRITPATDTFRVRYDLSQHDHIDGLPVGTRGGMLIKYDFPVDGEYIIRPKLWKTTVNQVGGLELPHELEITFDGERVKLASVGGAEDERKSYEFPSSTADEIESRFETRIPIKAGTHAIGVAFLKKSSAPPVELLQPFLRDRIDPISPAGIPELDRVTIEGPFNAKASNDSPSRRRIFICRPEAAADPLPCAKKIIATVGRRAYRRPLTEAETTRLITFFENGRKKTGNFDDGIENALVFMMVSPQFLFRFEYDPPKVAPGTVYRVSDLELASRLSFFIWSSIPDDTLLDLAVKGRLKDPAVLEQQVKRMLADERARALGANFAGQWLYLRNMQSVKPDDDLFPDFDDNLRQSLKRETEMLFESIVLEDRSALDLLNANYTFVNERLAKHYGIAGIYGDQMRRVTVKDDYRRGLLGQGSILTITSMANRTSPVNRGKYVLTNILGTPPPSPPANVPPLNEAPGKSLSMRDRMAEHRSNVVCANCHKLMDPIGLALENFDAIGRWRTTDNDAAIDPSDTVYNGTKVNGPVDLRNMILSHPDQFVRTMTEMLMTYGIGRGLEYYDMPAVRSIVKDATRTNYRFSALVLGIVRSAPFQMKKG